MQNIGNPGLNTLLTPKEFLGYSHEMRGQKLLAKLGISFNGNPADPILWKANIEHGTDIKTYIFQLEFKYCNFRVYPSHVYRHVLPRFDGADYRIKVVVTNNKARWCSVKYILEANGILLWTLDDLKNYYTTPSFISIFNFINHNVEGTSLVKDNFIILSARMLKFKSVNEKVVSKSVEVGGKAALRLVPRHVITFHSFQGMEVREDGKEEES
jgi:hypothetical protein